MAQRAHVPQFGKWEGGDNVPYTVYFDNARKGRTGGRIINPNDPQENPDLVSDYAAPAWEGKSSHDGSHGTPERSRMNPRGDDRPDKGAAVPKFGEWDVSDPASADGYTHIFNQMREEKQVGAVRAAIRPTEASHASGHKQAPRDSSKGCCFPWCR